MDWMTWYENLAKPSWTPAPATIRLSKPFPHVTAWNQSMTGRTTPGSLPF